MNDNTSGRKWSRFALGFGAVMSILGNETHTVLTPGHVGIVIRVALAAIWPVALFVAVEVLVRVNWRAQFIDYAGRFVMMFPVTVVAAVVSYQHLHALMELAGEDGVSALIGPVAIDGLMVGGTVALLAIRAAGLTDSSATLTDELSISQPMDPDFQAWTEELELTAPVSPAPAESVTEQVQVRSRSPRAKWDARRVCELAVEGRKVAEAKAETEIGPSTYARYLRVAKILREDRHAPIDASEKVPADHVAIIRELVAKR